MSNESNEVLKRIISDKKLLEKEGEKEKFYLIKDCPFAYPFEDDSAMAEYTEKLRTFSKEELKLIERKKKKKENLDKIKFLKKNRKS